MEDGSGVVVDQVARAGESFAKDFYYHVCDSSKHELYRFYKEDSVVLWNGNAKRGLQSLNEFFKQLPPTKHEVTSVDCHPMPGAQPSTMLVSVAGSVSYANDPPRCFSQTFVLAQDKGKATFFIVNDCYRLTT